MTQWHLKVSVMLLTLTGAGWIYFSSERLPSKSAFMPFEGSTVRRPRIPSKSKNLPQLALIYDSNLHWEERIDAVRALPEKLERPTLESLFAFLEQAPNTGVSHWYLVCNEVMEVLRKGNQAPEIYTSKHLALVQSATADPVIRDYAAQHLGQWISGIDPISSKQDPVQAQSVFKELCAEASNPSNGQLTLAGTILNTLADAVTNGSPAMQLNHVAVGKLALQILDAPQELVSNVNRASAIQVAARLQVPELPGRCRTIARDPQAAPDLRLSAIAALGLVGSTEDRALLQSFVSDEAFKFAAAAAVERVDQNNSRP